MLKTGEKVLLGSDAAGKYYGELTGPADEPATNWKVTITCEHPDKRVDSLGVPVAVIDALAEKIRHKEVRRPQEEE
jgi:hypothetical protein